MRRARARAFRNIPNGIPGVETRLPILFSEGVMKGRISLQRFAALTATNHARLYGLYPRKGSIAVGGDADLTLWDPAAQRTIRQADLHHGADYTPWEGLRGDGLAGRDLLRGTLVMRDGDIASAAPRGAFPWTANCRRPSCDPWTTGGASSRAVQRAGADAARRRPGRLSPHISTGKGPHS